MHGLSFLLEEFLKKILRANKKILNLKQRNPVPSTLIQSSPLAVMFQGVCTLVMVTGDQAELFGAVESLVTSLPYLLMVSRRNRA